MFFSIGLADQTCVFKCLAVEEQNSVLSAGAFLFCFIFFLSRMLSGVREWLPLFRV